jgi:hypothetical protein
MGVAPVAFCRTTPSPFQGEGFTADDGSFEADGVWLPSRFAAGLLPPFRGKAGMGVRWSSGFMRLLDRGPKAPHGLLPALTPSRSFTERWIASAVSINNLALHPLAPRPPLPASPACSCATKIHYISCSDLLFSLTSSFLHHRIPSLHYNACNEMANAAYCTFRA